MPLPGQNFCPSCMKPVRTPGKCAYCLEKEARIVKGGLFCDHCKKNGSNVLIYLNKKTKKRYCVDCRADFRSQLMFEGFKEELATKIMVEDFVLLNDPIKRRKK